MHVALGEPELTRHFAHASRIVAFREQLDQRQTFHKCLVHLAWGSARSVRDAFCGWDYGTYIETTFKISEHALSSDGVKADEGCVRTVCFLKACG